jgi:hypothetical protein
VDCTSGCRKVKDPDRDCSRRCIDLVELRRPTKGVLEWISRRIGVIPLDSETWWSRTGSAWRFSVGNKINPQWSVRAVRVFLIRI